MRKKHGLSWKLVDLKSLYEWKWVDDEKDGENDQLSHFDASLGLKWTFIQKDRENAPLAGSDRK